MTRILTILAVLLAHACDGYAPERPENAWDEPDHYEYTLHYSSFSPWAGTYRVAVRHGDVIAVEPLDVWDSEYALTAEDAWTIGDILDLYYEAVDSPDAVAEITWDTTTGAPESVSIDWWIEAVDDEQYFGISDIEESS